MILILSDTPILEHSDSDFDAASKKKLASLGRNITIQSVFAT